MRRIFVPSKIGDIGYTKSVRFNGELKLCLGLFPTLKGGFSSLKFFVNVYEFLIPIFIFTICYYMEFEWISYV
jgi:hypothetical protein